MERVSGRHINFKFTEFLNTITRTELYQSGVIGIVHRKIDQTKMEPNKKELLKNAFTLGISGAILFEAAACAKGYVAPTPEPGNSPNTTEISPNATLTGEERQKQTVDSFVEANPEYAGREIFAINVSIQGNPVDTVLMKSTDQEKQEIDSYKYKFEGQELQPFDNAVVYTLKTDFDGTKSWVRLAGVYFPATDGSVITAWYYSPDAFDKSKETIDFNKRVFGFNSKDSNFVFWPLYEPATTLMWSDDLGSTDPDDYTNWNGKDPYTISMVSIPEAPAKVIFDPMPITTPTTEVTTPTETFEVMELSTDPEKPTICTYEDITSGRWAWNVKQQAQPFPEGAVNLGWERSERGSTSNLVFVDGSIDAIQEPFICKTTGEFEGLPDKNLYVLGLPVLNKDGSTGVLNLFVSDSDYKNNLSNLLRKMKESNGTRLELVTHKTNVEENWTGKFAFSFRLYRTQDEKKVVYVTNQLEISDNIPADMEKMLFTGVIN